MLRRVRRSDGLIDLGDEVEGKLDRLCGWGRWLEFLEEVLRGLLNGYRNIDVLLAVVVCWHI